MAVQNKISQQVLACKEQKQDHIPQIPAYIGCKQIRIQQVLVCIGCK